MSKQRKYRVIENVSPRPNAYERSAAELVSIFLRADVEFLPVSRAKSPDLLIANQRWEIKTPTGSSARTVMHQFQRTTRQAEFLIFDARRIKMTDEVCLKRVLYEFKLSRTIKRVIYISKDGGRVMELEK